MSLGTTIRSQNRPGLVHDRLGCGLGLIVAVLLGCGGVETNVIPTSRFDPTLKATPEQIFSSARTDEGRLAIAGLPGALPPSVRFQIYQEGTPHLLADGMASDKGAFALWLDINEPRVVIRALSPDQSVWGPDIPINIGADPMGIRPVSRALFSAATDPSQQAEETARVTGLSGAAPPEQMVVVGGIDTPDAVATFAGGAGEFFTAFRGRSQDRVVLFVVSMSDDNARSIPIEAELNFGDFPIILTPRSLESPAATAFIAPAGQLKPESTVTVNVSDESLFPQVLSSGQDGAVGGCIPELALHEDVEIAGTGAENGTRVAHRTIQFATSEVSLFSEGLEWHFEENVGVWFQGDVPPDLLSMVAVNCRTGEARQEAVTGDFKVGLPLAASSGDVIAVFGISREGIVGAPIFLGADTGMPVAVPIPRLGEEQLVTSAIDGNGQGVILGRPTETGDGVLIPHANVEIIGAFDNRAVFDGNANGHFAILVGGLTPSEPLSIVQSLGPFRSDPLLLSLPEYVAADFPLPPAAGLLSAHADGKGRIRVAGYAPVAVGSSVILANLRTGSSVETTIQDGTMSFQTELSGEDGDALVIVAREDGKSSIHAVRPASGYDVPFLVSAASERVCVVGPATTAEDVDTVQIQWHAEEKLESMPLLRGMDDSWIAMSDEGHFADETGIVSLRGLSGGEVKRSTAALQEIDVEGVQVAGGAAGLRLSDVGGQLDSSWMVAVATPGGAVRVIRPPEKAAWTLPLDLPVQDYVWIFAVHLSSKTASGCHRIDVAMDPLPDDPTIDTVAPNPVVQSKPFTIQGAALTGASVTIGGVLQDMMSENDGTWNGNVHPATPLGKQPLRVTTLAGMAEHWVEVAPVPTIDAVLPIPLMVGKVATITGSGFGTNTEVWLGGHPLPVIAATDTMLEVRVTAELKAGAWNMTVFNGVASAAVTVALVCPVPIVSVVEPEVVLLGSELTLNGNYLWNAKVRVNGQLQQLNQSSDTMATLTLDTATPLGFGLVTATTSCGFASAPTVVATSEPVVSSVFPAVAVVGLPFNVYGDHLAGASVQLGGVLQTLNIDSKKGLAFMVAPDTPLGQQLLVISTMGGSVSLVVPVSMLPSIGSIDPAAVMIGGEFIITGSHLAGASVTVGDVPAVLLSDGDSQLVVKVAPGTPVGMQSVVVTTMGGMASASIVVLSGPSVTGIQPDPLVRGEGANITGLNLVNAQLWLDDKPQKVSKSAFGLIEWMVSSDVALGEHILRLSTPGGELLFDVTVVEPPNVQSVEPSPLKVGSPAVITGSGFGVGGLSVSVSGVPQLVTSSSATTIDLEILPGTPVGTQLLIVATQYSTASVTVEIAQPPVISGVNPSTTVTGTTVKVVGLGLAGGTVTVGGVSADAVTGSDTQIDVTLSVDTPSGLQTLKVATPIGTASWPLEVLPLPPVVTQVQPYPVLVGESIGIDGKNLLGASVKLGGVLVAIQTHTATHITGVVSSATPTGNSQTLVVQTAGGIALFSVTVGDESMMGSPSISQLTPNPVSVGGTATLEGFNLKDATVSIAGTPAMVSATSMTQVTFAVAAGTAQGDQTLQLVTSQGSASVPVTVLPPLPIIAQCTPNPVAIGMSLTIHGTALQNLQSIELGGVLQNIVTTFQEDKVVFQVKDSTPTGLAIPLVLTTLSGAATSAVDVEPAPPKPIEVLDVSPTVAGIGESVTITGLGLSGVIIEIAGVPQVLTSNPSDLLVTFLVAPMTPSGNQSMVLSKEAVDDVSVAIGIRPEPPTDALVYLSGLSATGDAVMAALPGAFLGDAMVLLDVGNALITTTSQPDGSLGQVFSSVSDGAVITIQQSVDGFVSEAMMRTIVGTTNASPPTPHAYLTRVETLNGDLHVYGPSPTFGAGNTIVVAVTGGRVGHALASDLHADPTQGIVMDGMGVEGSLVWVVALSPDETQPGSVALETYALPYDPPILTSGMYGGTLCIAALPGTVPSGTATLTVGDWDVPVSATGTQGSFFAQAVHKMGTATPQGWTAKIGAYTVDGSVAPESLAPLSSGDVQITSDGQGGLEVTVSAAAVGAYRWLVAATSTGEVGAAAEADILGNMTVHLPHTGETMAVWTVPWTGSDPSGCVELSIDQAP